MVSNIHNVHLKTHSAYAASSSFRVFLDYRQADFDGISSFLLDYDFSSYYKSYDIEFLWGYLKDTILSSIYLFAPADKKRSHCYPQWFTSLVRHQLHKVHSQRKKWRINPTPQNTSCLSAAESFLHTEISNTRTAFESSLVEAFAFSKFYVYSSLVFYLFFNTPNTSSTYWCSFSTTNYNFDYHLIHFIYTHSSCLYWETKKKCELLSYPKSKCVINEMAKTAGYEAVCIPPYHCELIPIELCWLQVKRYIKEHNEEFTLTAMKHLTYEGFNK